MKKAFITGVAGQDGSYLSEYLLKKGYEVHGLVRRNSVPENQSSRLDFSNKNFYTHYGDLLDEGGLNKIISELMPDEIYNLAAQSHVRISFDIPQFTAKTNAIGVLNMLEAFRLNEFFDTFLRALYSSVISISMMILIESLFSNKKSR